MNLSALNNMSPFIINTSIVENPNEIIPNLISNTNTQTDNWFGLLIMLAIFFYLLWILTKNTGNFRFDFIKGLVYSSGFALIVGAVMLVTDITTTYNHVVWFGIVFTLAMISAWFLKQKGL